MAVDDIYTKSLLHFDGNLTDESGKIWNAYGGVATSGTQKKFGESSFLTDADGKYIMTTSSLSDLTFGTGDFTIDWWMYFRGCPPGRGIFGCGDYTTSNDKFGLYPTADYKMQFYIAAVVMYVAPSPCPLNTWAHHAFVRYSGTLYYYVDGVLQGYVASTHYIASPYSFFIGAGMYQGIYYSCNSYIDEFRISTGIARWTANFTPPTAPYGPIILPSRKTLIPNAILSTSQASRGW